MPEILLEKIYKILLKPVVMLRRGERQIRGIVSNDKKKIVILKTSEK